MATRGIKEVTAHDLATLMVGREVKETHAADFAGDPDAVMLEVRGVTDGLLKDVSFKVRRGEILGFSGLIGAGRTELMEVIFGIRKPETGQVLIEGKPVTIRSAMDAIRAEPRVRHRGPQGDRARAVPGHPRERQLRHLAEDRRASSRAARLRRPTTRQMIERLAIRCKSPAQDVGNLSGGNQQKVALAKWLLSGAQVLVLDEPTRGVDVGARQEIYRIIRELAAEGVAIVIVSSDLPEILAICERVIVMHEGRVTGELNASELSEAKVMYYATDVQAGERRMMEAIEKRPEGGFLGFVKRIWREYSVVVVFVAIILISGAFAPRFLSPGNLLNILQEHLGRRLDRPRHDLRDHRGRHRPVQRPGHGHRGRGADPDPAHEEPRRHRRWCRWWSRSWRASPWRRPSGS